MFPAVSQSKRATEGHTSRALRPGFRQRHTGMRMCDFNAEGVAARGVRIRRHVTSWYAFVIVLLGLGLAKSFGLTMLRNQVEQRARKAAYDTASVAVALMVHRNVTEADFTGATGLTAIGIGDLDADVATLVREHRLVGLELWRSDGVNVYSDPGHPPGESILPPDEVARIATGEPWIVTNATDRSVRTWEIFVPYDAGSDGVFDGLVEVLIPDARDRRCGGNDRPPAVRTRDRSARRRRPRTDDVAVPPRPTRTRGKP